MATAFEARSAYDIMGPVDPWGNPLRPTTPAGGVYSFGPNGMDDHQLGDDVVPSDPELALAGVLWRSRIAFIAAALLVAWCSWGPYVRTPRGTLLDEVERALILSLGPITLGFGLVWPFGMGAIYDLYLRPVWTAPLALVPVGVAMAVTWLTVPWLLALAWRMSRESEASEVVAKRSRVDRSGA